MKTSVMVLWCAWVLWSHQVIEGSNAWSVWEGAEDATQCWKLTKIYRETLLAKGADQFRQEGRMTISRLASGKEVRQEFICLPNGTDPREPRR